MEKNKLPKTYEEACAMLSQFFSDPADIVVGSEYMKKYF